MEQDQLFSFDNDKPKNKFNLGKGLILEVKENYPRRAILSQNGIVIKRCNLADRTAKKLLVIEALEHGAMKLHLASALQMSRQTIDNYQGTVKHFGLEGLIKGYNPSDTKSLRIQRDKHAELNKRIPGNRARQLEQIRHEQREKREDQGHEQCVFKFGYEDYAILVEPENQPFSEQHDWQPSRYAGVATYLVALITEWKWLQLVMGYFGSGFKIFMVFLLMAARNIRSIEKLKNVRHREAGIVLGLKHLASKPKLWQWFYSVSDQGRSNSLLSDYFRYQICSGLVGLQIWFTDGHLLPYTGKHLVHYSYNTQRRMPVPGQTSMVTCDQHGRIVGFEIHEGKGNLKQYILNLAEKWNDDLPCSPVMVFDREGSANSFYSKLVLAGSPFVAWQKNINAEELAGIEDCKFDEPFEFNAKSYKVFEDEKIITCCPAEDTETGQHCFKLRHIFIWNQSSKRKTCALAWTGDTEMSTIDCASAILHRWGASENTFKHTKERHPLHYHPGFKLVESDRQEIKNPALKQKADQIKRIKKELKKLYKKISKAKEVLNKDGSPRENSVRERIQNDIHNYEAELDKLNEEKKALPEKVDPTTLEDSKSIKKIDNEGKNLFDFVTASVWNARKMMVSWLRSFYSQDNDVVDLFYAIADCHGWIKSTKTEVIVRLEPLQQHSRRMAQEELCRKLTNMGAQTPNGKWIKIEVGESPI
ncbi:MAG: hypothetical protein MUO88_23795 [Desulfobacterales bacterium]|nr:hypothetical protein [Desulfobacterales bacterium]